MSGHDESAELRRRLAERERRRADFLSVVSHDLKTPLNAVVGFTSVLLLDASAGSDPEMAHRLKLVYDSAQILLGRLNALVEFQRLQAGKTTVRSDWLVPEGLLRESVERLRPAAEAAGRELSLVPAPDLPSSLHSDGRLLGLALDELASNALRFGGAGPIRFGAYARPASDDSSGELRWTVDDDGNLTEEQLQRLRVGLRPGVDLFDEEYAGLGLGLVLAREAMRALDGWIEVEPLPSGGHRFSLVLPLPTTGATHIVRGA